jgi:hypothetical protein
MPQKHSTTQDEAVRHSIDDVTENQAATGSAFETRRRFLKLGAAALAAFGAAGCGSRGESPVNPAAKSSPRTGDLTGSKPSAADAASPLDLERWQKIRGLPY